MGNVTTVGIDLAKNVFSVHGVDGRGAVVLRKTVSRARLADVVAQLPACLIGLEACSGAHEWARRFQAARPHGEADGTEVRGAVSQERQERQQRCGGDLRGGESARACASCRSRAWSSKRC